MKGDEVVVAAGPGTVLACWGCWLDASELGLLAGLSGSHMVDRAAGIGLAAAEVAEAEQAEDV